MLLGWPQRKRASPSGITRRTQFTTTYKQGDIVIVSFPFTDLSAAKKRPAVVVSPDSFNSQRLDLVLAAVTSHLTTEAEGILVDERDLMDGLLPKQSMIKPTKLFTIHSSLIIKKISRLKEAKRDEVLKSLRHFFR